ncbi:MAG: MATE family efflux transporter [Alistipes sp.]|jgi:MATE family multidrug resistance protein|nr:MATE family efflux transporter [Alistipes sp.]
MNSLKAEYPKTLRLALPIALTQVGQLVVQIVDNAMVGHLGAVPLAGVAFGGNVFFFLFIFGLGLAMGSTPLVGELYAQGRHRSSAQILQNSVALFTLIGMLICVAQMSIIQLFPYMNQPAEVIAAGTPYYRYLAWSIIPLMLFFSFRQFLEGVGNTRVEMVVTIICNALNIGLNWVFIYGNLGFPAMGAEGAGLATLISRSMMPVMVIGYFVWNSSYRRYLSFYHRANWSGERVMTLLAVGFPISLQMTLEGGAFAITGIMMGWLGTEALAANQVAILICNMAFLIVLSIGSASTIRVSHAYGLNDFAAIRRIAHSSWRIGVVWNVVMALVFITCRHLLPRIFTTDPAVIEIAGGLLILVAIFQVFDGLQSTSLCILRGMQDVKVTSLVALVSYIIINLPVGYLFAFVLGWGPQGLWVGFVFGLFSASVLLIARFRRIVARLERGSSSL